MIINLSGIAALTDDQLGALADCAGVGENESPPAFNRRDPIEASLRWDGAVTCPHATLVAVQGDYCAEYEDGEWRTWARCDTCDEEWLSDVHPDDAECPRCTAIATKDTGEW